MKTNLLLFFLFIAFSSFSQNKLIGNWTCTITEGYTMSLNLKVDGSGTLDDNPIRYEYTSNTLTIIESVDYSNVYNYSLSGNQLTLSGGDLETPLVFRKNGGNGGLSAKVNQNSSRGSTTTAHKSNENSISTSNKIIGVWEGNNETIEFKENGTVNYIGQDYQYILQDGHVTFVTNQGNVMFRYSINGNQLTLFGNNQSVTYSRSNGKAAKFIANGFPENAPIAQELVGKWCYLKGSTSGGYSTNVSSSSECITIYANGTYEYYYEGGFINKTSDMSVSHESNDYDKGTWRLVGNTLYVQSQKSGLKRYTLQKINKGNDPMIVIDGRSFVTYYRKDPW